MPPAWLDHDEATKAWVATIINEHEAGAATVSVKGCPVDSAPHISRSYIRDNQNYLHKISGEMKAC